MNPDDRLRRLFPKLKKDSYEITSPDDAAYNCIAWAADVNDVWWEPDPWRVSYWPDGASRGYTIEAYVSAFRILGFEECQNEDPEDGYKKIALFAKDNFPKHAARQLDSGLWTSKIGSDVDIEHKLPDLTGHSYGEIVKILKRRK